MKKNKTTILVAVSVFAGMIAGQAIPARAQLGDILKGGLVIVAVDQFAGEINRFVNTVTGARTGVRETTKVVPILSIGQGTYVGAVQVTGPQNLVNRVRAVAQLEANTRIAGGEVRVRGLIPVSSRTVTDIASISRVNGVGVSALIDLRL